MLAKKDMKAMPNIFFSACILALEIIDKKKLDLNVEKVLKMILYHEIGEIKIGDLTPFDNVSKEEKYKKEYNAIKNLF